jgi:hypothetical protein
MTSKQGKQQAKVVRILVILNENITGIIALDTNLIALMVLMANTVSMMNAYMVIQTTNLSGKTNTKKVNSLLMGFKGFAMAQLVMLYAKSIGDEDMEAAANISYTDLTVGTAAELLARNTIIYNLIHTNVTAMITAGFKIVSGDPAAYLLLITNWNTSVPSWTSAKSLRVAATNGQEICYKTIVTDQMPELRKFMVTYNTVATQSFYDAMENAMKGTSTPTRRLRAIFTFVDGRTMTKIAKVTGTLTLDMIPRTFPCSKVGILKYSDLPNGVATLDAVKPGYIPVHLGELVIDDEDVLRVTVEMFPIVTTTSKAVKSAEAKGTKSRGKKITLTLRAAVNPAAITEVVKEEAVKVPEAKKEVAVKKKK